MPELTPEEIAGNNINSYDFGSTPKSVMPGVNSTDFPGIPTVPISTNQPEINKSLIGTLGGANQPVIPGLSPITPTAPESREAITAREDRKRQLLAVGVEEKFADEIVKTEEERKGTLGKQGAIAGAQAQGMGFSSAEVGVISMINRRYDERKSDLEKQKSEALRNLDIGTATKVDAELKRQQDRFDSQMDRVFDQFIKGRADLRAEEELKMKKGMPLEISPGASMFDPITKAFIGTAPMKPADGKPTVTKADNGDILQYEPTTDTWKTVAKGMGATTSDITNYNFAVTQGETKSFTDWMAAQKASTNKAKTIFRNDPASGRLLRVKIDENGNETSIEVVKSPIEAIKGQVVYAQDNSPAKLTDTQATFLSQGLTLQGLAEDVKTTLQNVDTSAIKGWYTEKGYLVPVVQDTQDPKMLDLMNKMYAMNNLFVYFSTGKQINEAEFEKLSKQVPNLKATPEYNQTAVTGFLNLINDRMNNYLNVNGWKFAGGGSENTGTKKTLDSSDPFAGMDFSNIDFSDF